MTDLLQRLRERKLLQRTLAYAIAAFALLQSILVADRNSLHQPARFAT